MRDALTCMLKAAGFQVLTAEDGLIGLAVAETELPDLIVTDIEMPRLDGIKMIMRLREQLRFSDVPILVISACAIGPMDEAMKAGADQAMHKPVDFNSFIFCINHLLAA